MRKWIFIGFNVMLVLVLGGVLVYSLLDRAPGDDGDDDATLFPGDTYAQIKHNLASYLKARKDSRDFRNKKRYQKLKEAERLDRSMFRSAQRNTDNFFKVLADRAKSYNPATRGARTVRQDCSYLLDVAKRIATPEMFKRIKEYYKGIDPKKGLLRSDVILTVGKFKGEGPLDFIRAIVEKAPDAVLRRTAIRVLGRMRPEKAWPIILKVAKDEKDQPTREKAVAALQNFQNPEVCEFLGKLVADSAEPVSIRRMAIVTLSKSAGEKAVPVLVSVLKAESNWDVKARVIQALGSIGKTGRSMDLVYVLREYLDFEDDEKLRGRAFDQAAGIERAISNPRTKPRARPKSEGCPVGSPRMPRPPG